LTIEVLPGGSEKRATPSLTIEVLPDGSEKRAAPNSIIRDRLLSLILTVSFSVPRQATVATHSSLILARPLGCTITVALTSATRPPTALNAPTPRFDDGVVVAGNVAAVEDVVEVYGDSVVDTGSTRDG